MSTTARDCVAILVVSAVLAVVAARPPWLRSLGVEWAAPERQAVTWFQTDGPSPEVEVARMHSAAKARVVEQVAAGEIDLFEAAAMFRSIARQPPEFANTHYRLLPGRTDEEKLCRQVILWAKSHLGEERTASEVARVVAGLEKALADRLGRDGRIVLPDRP